MKDWRDCTPEQKIERWENVLRVLSSLSPHERRRHWDMSLYGEKTECGTVACAAGHCGLDPWFRRRGFTMDFFKDLWGTRVSTLDDGQKTQDFFGFDGCEQIFWDGRRRSVKVVIGEVREYIEELRTNG